MSTNKNIFEKNLLNECPHGFCDYIQSNAEVLVVILCLDGFIFFVTLLPPLFSWSKKKPDGRKRIYFAALACFTFYFWLAFLAVNSLYCFGFLAHHGPCETSKVPSNSSSMQSPRQSDSTLVSAPDPTIPTFQTLPENTGENPPTRTSRSTHAILQAAASTSSITSLLTSGPSLRMLYKYNHELLHNRVPAAAADKLFNHSHITSFKNFLPDVCQELLRRSMLLFFQFMADIFRKAILRKTLPCEKHYFNFLGYDPPIRQ